MNFQNHFTEAYNDMKISQQTAQQGGYHTSNTMIEEYVNTTATALANLAAEQQQDKSTIESLASQFKFLMKQLKAKEMVITTLQQSLQYNGNRKNNI